MLSSFITNIIIRHTLLLDNALIFDYNNIVGYVTISKHVKNRHQKLNKKTANI